MNEIKNSYNVSDDNPIYPTNSNLFTIIYLPSKNDESSLSMSISELNNSQFTNRKYFGPVSIERLKITLQDDKGTILNLYGHNWSFTILADLLYQF